MCESRFSTAQKIGKENVSIKNLATIAQKCSFYISCSPPATSLYCSFSSSSISYVSVLSILFFSHQLRLCTFHSLLLPPATSLYFPFSSSSISYVSVLSILFFSHQLHLCTFHSLLPPSATSLYIQFSLPPQLRLCTFNSLPPHPPAMSPTMPTTATRRTASRSCCRWTLTSPLGACLPACWSGARQRPSHPWP